MIEYKYNEGELLKQFKEYIDATYNQHYSMNRYQATEFIIDNGHGVGFTAGNVMKYVQVGIFRSIDSNISDICLILLV